MEKISQSAERLASTPTHSRLGFKLLEKDPVLELARKLGFKVTEFDLPPYPVERLLGEGSLLMAFMLSSTLVCYLLYHYVNKNALLRHACIGGMVSALIAWPVVTGQSGIMLLDFWKPALGFRSCLLVWDIFQIRTREEVQSWNFARFFCHLWAFPLEEEEIAERDRDEGFHRSARVQNAKGLPKVLIEGIVLLLTLYIVPPYELTKNMSQLAYHCYCDALGLSILMALALFGDGLLKTIGIFCNVEMADMFENPLGTVNIRLFWSHWNRAIATVLHRVVFGGGRQTPSSVKAKQRKEKQEKKDRVAQLQQQQRNRKHLDHLSETEAEASKTDDEDEHRLRRNGLKPLTSTANGAKDNGGQQQQKKSSSNKPKSSFLPKALAAIATFAMSGIFHEWITLQTLNYAGGENFVFFLLNGVATVTSTWFRRTFPEANAKIPTLVAVLLLHLFFLTVIPLFCAPFIRSGFFVQMQSLRYELLPVRAHPRGSFIWLFGQ
ncbi:hypothetical protein FA10DRAFT_272938 [Acaromyces ingoldii]|uniref:Wax synthase domain-containing protein n=1 Tax=Acaromyces ingoldii TaxID=215250 RepID=A0A316YHX9_9BASI|nr:hypothetical protein FA10DRAFT_272938 [Acaromyces ingoldii]PWN88676.1 hypothetical protein FA10DRAFT_272938 [Acaromyces ingoldii]